MIYHTATRDGQAVPASSRVCARVHVRTNSGFGTSKTAYLQAPYVPVYSIQDVRITMMIGLLGHYGPTLLLGVGIHYGLASA